ncbi:MAG: acyltransferase [Nitrospirae bacterium]|nr:acyltransferase [Nitrospirota bacterium]
MAALIVVTSHFSNETLFIGGKLGSGAGQTGVMLFFALSSFLMFHLYWHHSKILKSRCLYTLAFLKNRFARIYPIFVFSIFLSYLFSLLGYEYLNIFKITKVNILKHIYLYQTDSVMWTISKEMVFYLLFAVMLIIPKAITNYIIIITITITLYLFESITPNILGENFRQSLIRTIGSAAESIHVYKYFIVGAITYFITICCRQYFNQLSNKLIDLFLSCILLVTIFLYFPQIHGLVFGHRLNEDGWNSLNCGLACSSMIIGAMKLPAASSGVSIIRNHRSQLRRKRRGIEPQEIQLETLIKTLAYSLREKKDLRK